MRKIIYFVIVNFYLMSVVNLVYGQDFKPLQIGDTIPEAFYKEVAKLGSAGIAFAESKGKLVILDFWSIYCSACIEYFPKMEGLQNDFNDEIKVFMVNTFEDSLKISERMGKPNLKRYAIGLPSITNARVFQQIFPHKIVPHHVWIDKDRVVRVIGSPLNTNSKKIKDLLDGKEILSLNGVNNTNSVDKNTSLYKIVGAIIKDNESSHLFTAHSNDYTASAPSVFRDVIDSTLQLSRDTYINNDVLELYKQVYFEEIAENRNRMVYSGVYSAGSGFWRDYFILDFPDTLMLSSAYVPFLERTDQQYIQSRFCYEQLSPFDSSVEERRSCMLQNLNQYFGELYGITGELVQQDVPCYVLKSANGNKVIDSYKGMTPLNMVLSYPIFQLFSKNPNDYLSFMIDETGLEDITGLNLPDYKKNPSFDDLVLALNEFGITVDQELRTLSFILIRNISEYKK